MDEVKMKEHIVESTLLEINDKGLKFTMDDVARRGKVSKKTIYCLFDDKESLCMEVVDYCFSKIKESEKQILEDKDMPLEDKIKKILIVLPDRYSDVDFRKIGGGKEKYPKVYAEIMHRLNSGWEPTIALLQEGIDTGLLRPFPIPIFKTMVESSISRFLDSDELVEAGISYEEALRQMLDLLWEGICKR